jgi:hypothetical protein
LRSHAPRAKACAWRDGVFVGCSWDGGLFLPGSLCAAGVRVLGLGVSVRRSRSDNSSRTS